MENFAVPKSLRYALAGFGWLCIGIGVVGIIVPGLPTTVFMLMAAWAFSRSSPRFRQWLLAHPRLGPPIAAWRDSGAIPRRAKLLAVTTMTASLACYIAFAADNWAFPTALAAAMVAVAVYILTRPDA